MERHGGVFGDSVVPGVVDAVVGWDADVSCGGNIKMSDEDLMFVGTGIAEGVEVWRGGGGGGEDGYCRY